MADEQELFVKGDTEGEYVRFEQPTFTDQLPEDLRENESFKEVTNVGDLAERHVNTVKELTELKSAQTVPEQYEVPEIPEGIPKDDQGIKDFSALAKDLGLSQDTFNKIIEFDLARAERYSKGLDEFNQKALEDGEKALKDKWGPAYETNKEQASMGLRKVLGAFKDGEEIEKELKESGFLNLPSVVRVFRKIGVATSEGVFIQKDTSPDTDDIPRGKDGRPILTYPSMEGLK